MIKYNSTTGKWENWTPTYLTSYTETDPVYVAWNKSTGISITASQVSNFQSNVTNNSAVLANTAKISYPPADATKLAGIAIGAEVNVNADWNATSGDAQILNKPTTLAGYGITDAVTTSGDQTIAGVKTFTGAISADNHSITNVSDPVNDKDAANKAYVDALKQFSISRAGDTLYLGNDKFVIIPGISTSNPSGVGTTPVIPDITWSQVTVGASSDFAGWVYIAYGNNTFVAVTDNNCASLNNSAYVSSDFGSTWTQKATPGSTDISGIAFSPANKYFSISFRCYENYRNYAYSSDNGTMWTPLQYSYPNYRYDLFRVKDYFFSSVAGHTSDRSEDGVNWTNLTFAGTSTVSVSNYSERFGLYYASDGTNFWTSSDASIWTKRDAMDNSYFVSGNNVVLAYAYFTSSPIIKKTVDGLTFAAISNLPNITYLWKIKFINGLFWAIFTDNSDTSKKLMVSADGAIWKVLDTPAVTGSANDIEIGYDSNLKKNVIIIPCVGGIFLRGIYN